MPNVKFYLEKRRDRSGRRIAGMRPVMLYFSFRAKRLQVYTGVKADQDAWDPKKCRMEPFHPDSRHINPYLDALESEVLRLYNQATARGISPDTQWLRDRLHIRHGNKRTAFFDVFLVFIRRHTEKWSLNTFKKVKVLYHHLREFEREGYPVRFERIDPAFINNFLGRFRRRGFSNSSMQVYFNMLKWFMKWALEAGYHRNMDYQVLKFPYTWEVPQKEEKYGLTKAELKALEQWGPMEGRWEQSRKIFLFMCYTGLRYKQVGQLIFKTESEVPVVWISKKGGQQRIPLGQKALLLVRDIRSYQEEDGLESLVRFNQRIKEIAKQAGIRSIVRKTRHSGDQLTYRHVEKHERISSDTARQTFILHALDPEIRPPVFAGYLDRASLLRILSTQDNA